jgi:hypothetical protein
MFFFALSDGRKSGLVKPEAKGIFCTPKQQKKRAV